MIDDDVYQFWQRVDRLRGSRTLKEIADSLCVSYATLIDMRTKQRFPKIDICIKLSESLHTTLDYLYLGKTTQLCSTEARYVEDHPEARALVSQIMEDPALLQALATVIASCKKPINTKYTG